MVANAGILEQKTLVDCITNLISLLRTDYSLSYLSPSGTTNDFHRIMNVNALGVMLCYKHAARQMIKQGRGGRIIGL